jgi:hypothetical protein
MNFLIHSLTNEAVEAHIDHSLAVEVAKLYGTDAENVVHDEETITSRIISNGLFFHFSCYRSYHNNYNSFLQGG